jgi:superfamily II DNA or RNA helicase
MSVFALPADFDLSDHFDHTTLMRAIGLKPPEALLSQHPEGSTLHTRLRGNGATVYEQTISFFTDPMTGLHLRGLCTCPVGFNCQHVGAALMAYEAGLAKARRLGLSVEEVMPDGGAPVSRLDPPSLADAVRSGVRMADEPMRSSSSEPHTNGAEALPFALEAWLGSAAEMARADAQPGVRGRTVKRTAATRRLMFVLYGAQSRLMLKMHLGTLRSDGSVSRHHPHMPSVADMLRSQPVYVGEAHEALLAALLPFTLGQASTHLALHGTAAPQMLRRLVEDGSSWFVDDEAASPATPPGAPLRWSDEPLAVRPDWVERSEGAEGAEGSEVSWALRWLATDHATDAPRVLAVVLLPAPHVIVREEEGRSSVRPADVSATGLSHGLIDWLTRMPAVPAESLPVLVTRLRAVALQHQVVLPLPQTHAQALRELGSLRLQPVLRLRTCPNLPAEAFLEGHQRPPPAGQPLRRPALQLVLRYHLAVGAADAVGPLASSIDRADDTSVDFHFPAGASDIAFIEQPDPAQPQQTRLTRFRRSAEDEASALQRLIERFDLRPWSRVAAFAVDRLAALKAGLLQSAALPPALEDGKLVLVPKTADQWPMLLSEQLPALQAEGWLIERDEDFPFEVHDADEVELSIDEMPGSGADWFRIGLKVQVGGEPVDLVPLLVGLVQAGWLRLESSMQQPGGEVLLPWPDERPAVAVASAAGSPEAVASGTSRSGPPALRRERLLRLPVARIAPLIAWLRGVFGASGFKAAQPRVSRFELGAIEHLSTAMAVRAPPALGQLFEQLRSLREGEPLPAVAVSPNVHAELRPYQRDGLAWMDFLRRAGFGGVLADDMGLGKTLQTLALLQGELDAGRLDRPSLVVVPTSLLENWAAEASRFTPQLRMLVLHGKLRSAQFAQIADAHVVVTSYPLAVRDIDVLATHRWNYLVLDEAQRIKNSRSQATVALKGLSARHRLGLSGTPLENHLGELWSLMDFVTPGLLGGETKFREIYRTPIEKRGDRAQAELLSRRVRPFILRRTKVQVAQELPEKTETLLRVELEGTQRDLYETVRATMDGKLREAIARQGLARSQIVVLDALLRLRQVCCDPRLLKLAKSPSSAKLELLRELLPTLVEDGRRILVFSQFTEMLALIEPELDALDLRYLKLTGDTTNRGEVVDEFQNGDVPIFLISLKAGGVGLNLTAADTVILYDPWWNPAVEQQAIDRAYRIGQGKPVFVYKLVASGTVEEKMLELQSRKAGLADALLSGVAGTSALTAQDFDELFKPLGGG